MSVVFNPLVGDNSDYCTVPFDAAHNLTDAFSVSAWLYPVAWTGLNHIFVKYNDSYGLQCNNDAQQFRVDYRYGSGSWHWTNASTNFSTYTMYHVVGTFDKNASAPQLLLYIDGAYNNGTNATQAIYNGSSTGDIRIGKLHGSSSANSFHGAVDDIRLYNRALTAAEIQTIFACRGLDGIKNGMLLRYRFREGFINVTATGNAIDEGYLKLDAPYNGNTYYRESPIKIRRRSL